MKTNFRASIAQFLILGLAAAPLSSARAVGLPSTEFLTHDEYNKVCDANDNLDSDQVKMKESHCEAVDQKITAVQITGASAVLWTALASYCWAACGFQWTGGAAAGCKAAYWGVTGADAIAAIAMNDDFMQGVGPALGALYAKKQVAGFAKDIAEDQAKDLGYKSVEDATAGGAYKDQNRWNDACTSAVVATGMASMKTFVFLPGLQDSARAELKTAASFLPPPGSPNGTFGGGQTAAGLGSGGQGGQTGLGTQVKGASGKRGDAGALASSNGCGNLSSSGAVISCALSNDSSLPKFLGDPKFGDEFKKLTNIGLDDFIKNAPAGAGGVAGAVGGGGAAGAAFSNAMKKLEDGTIAYAKSGVAGTAYAGGGGGSLGGGGDGPDMNAMMAGIFDQFGPKKAVEKDPTGKTIAFQGLANRSPASLAEDTTVSIFDRVSFRYSRSTTSVGGSEWSLPANRVMHGLPHVMR